MKYSCYYIIHLGCLWALFNTFILFLGLTYWPRAQCQFLFFPLFQCFEEKEYQTESKRNETFWRSYFWKESNPGDLESTSRKQHGSHEVGGRAHPPRARPPTSWPPRLLLDVHSKCPGLRLFQKDRSRRFHSVWTLFDIPFLWNTKIGKKTAIRVGPPVSRLVPKMI